MVFENSDMDDLVSIVIPVYNAEKYIKESIQSCIQQDYKNIEVIVVNDGSKDTSRIEIEKCISLYDNVRLIDIMHSGKVRAINLGVENSKGKYIAIHAADDVCFPFRIREEVNIINLNKNISLVFGDMEVADENLNIVADSFWKLANIKVYSGKCFEKLLLNNFVSGGTILFKGEIKDKIFPIPETLPFEDWWIALAASYHGEIRYTNRKLIKYRQHSNNDNTRLNINNVSELVEKQKKLIDRNFKYYMEMDNLINNNCVDIEERTRYFNKIRYSKLISQLSITPGFINRVYLTQKNVNKFLFHLDIRNILKIFMYMLLGEKLLIIKYKKRNLKNNRVSLFR